VVFAIGFGAWELKWRAWGAEPTYRNSEGSWNLQRRRIDNGEGDKTVLLGASRVLFDVNLDTWQRTMGERPIQLAIEGTTPLPILEELANNPKFTGRVPCRRRAGRVLRRALSIESSTRTTRRRHRRSASGSGFR
jgi:hypothetical protein